MYQIFFTKEITLRNELILDLLSSNIDLEINNSIFEHAIGAFLIQSKPLSVVM